MPRVFIALAPWTPDAGELRNPGMLELQGVVPWGGDYVACEGLIRKVVGGGGTIGRGMHMNPNGTLYAAFPGVDVIAINTTVDPWTKASVAAVSTNAARFFSFGPHELLCGSTAIDLQIRLNGAGDFVTCITDPAANQPRAKFGAAMGNRVVLAYINDPAGTSGVTGISPTLVWTSATDNARIFVANDTSTAARVRSNPFFLQDDYGDITGMAGGRDFGVIFKQRNVYRVEYHGLGLEFYPLSPGVGTSSPDGWCWAGNDLYFMSNHGPARLRGDQVEIVGQVSRTLYDAAWRTFKMFVPTLDPERIDVTCAYDAAADFVVWSVTGQSANTGGLIVYSPTRNELTALRPDEDGTLIGAAGSSEAVFVSDMVSARVPTQGLALGGTIIAGVREGLTMDDFYAVSASGTLAPGMREVTLGTGYSSLDEDNLTRITAVRPALTLRPSETLNSMTLTVRSRNEPWGTPTDTVITSAELTMTNGWIPTPSAPEAVLHAIRMEFDDAQVYAGFDGFEVEYATGSAIGGF